MEAGELLKGAYDLHVHSGPDVMPRKMDDLELAERIEKRGMKGYVIKSHYFCTAERAKIIHKVFPKVHAVGALTLNQSVGGLNPMAVEMAARAGAKLIWMPTVDAANEQEHLKTHKPEKLPYWAKLQQEMIAQGKTASSIRILDDGKLKPGVIGILDIISQYDMILATGHLSREETFALIKGARDRKVKKVVITHPDFPSTLVSKEEQKELARMGAYMEHCFTTPQTNKTTWEAVYEQIRFVGPDHCVLSTDLGQPQGVYPDEGLRLFAANLLDHGFSTGEIRKMMVEIPTALVEG
jgi:hypothetical protein